MDEIDVLVAGTVFTDLVFSHVTSPQPGTEVYAEDFKIAPGGAANRAVAAARLGCKSSLFAEFGDDSLSKMTRAELGKEPNLDISNCPCRLCWQGPVTVALTDGTDRSFVTFEEDSSSLQWTSGSKIKVLHAGLAEGLPDWVQELRQDGTQVVGGVGWDASQTWSSSLLDKLSGVDILILNDAEACNYTHVDDVADALNVLSQYVDQVVITLNKKGSVALCGGTKYEISAVPNEATDPTGAGDVFTAGYMAATAWDWPYEQRLQLATIASAVSVGSIGGSSSAPGPREIESFLSWSICRGSIREQDWDFIIDWAKRDQGAGQA